VNRAPVRQPDHWVPKVAVALAVVGSATLGWLAFGRSNGSTNATSTRSAAAISTAVPTGLTSTTGGPTLVLRPVTTLPQSALPVSTLPVSTLPVTTLPTPVETTLPPQPASTTPPQPGASALVPDPAPGALTGPGNHQVMNDVLPSNAALADVLPAYATAEHLADVLAAHDWSTAINLLPTYPYGPAGLATNYGSINRFALLLLDARPDNGGYTLLIGAVTNENGGTQTSERCLHWYADTQSVEIQAEVVLAQLPIALSATDVRTNPTDDGRVRNGCTW
jgi:hypothetical protein